jgi:Protein of unknown function (DUF2877)
MDLAAAVRSHVRCSMRRLERSDCGRNNTIPILRSGILARKFCRDGAPAELAAVYERSVYLRSADTFLCIGMSRIGNGPITMIGDFGSSDRLSDLGLRPGLSASISHRYITIGSSVRFSFHQCELWRPSGWCLARPHLELTSICDAIVRLAAAEAPEEGFAQVYRLHERGINETPLARIARARIAHFESWLYDALEAHHIETTTSVAAILGLIGLGPGLTPSGDDFLVGALALLDALAERKAHAALAHAIAVAPRGLTSPLSDYLLRAAAAGHIGESLCCAISAVISGAIGSAVASIREIGHSSGWDMLVGAVSTLRVVAAARTQREASVPACGRHSSSCIAGDADGRAVAPL